MYLQIDKHASTPISRQIADQIRAQCLSGTLAAGEQIESVRQLATRLAVNPNTVLRVYEKLTAEGLLERRHGAGTFVAQRVDDGELTHQRDRFRQEWRRLAQHGHMLGFTDDQLRAMLTRLTPQTQPETPSANQTQATQGDDP